MNGCSFSGSALHGQGSSHGLGPASHVPKSLPFSLGCGNLRVKSSAVVLDYEGQHPAGKRQTEARLVGGGVFVLYGLVGAIQALRGKKFRYLIIGARLERHLHEGPSAPRDSATAEPTAGARK